MSKRIYGMMNEDGHTLTLSPNLEQFIRSIINLANDEKDFYEGYKPVVFEQIKGEDE